MQPFQYLAHDSGLVPAQCFTRCAVEHHELDTHPQRFIVAAPPSRAPGIRRAAGSRSPGSAGSAPGTGAFFCCDCCSRRATVPPPRSPTRSCRRLRPLLRFNEVGATLETGSPLTNESLVARCSSIYGWAGARLSRLCRCALELAASTRNGVVALSATVVWGGWLPRRLARRWHRADRARRRRAVLPGLPAGPLHEWSEDRHVADELQELVARPSPAKMPSGSRATSSHSEHAD